MAEENADRSIWEKRGPSLRVATLRTPTLIGSSNAQEDRATQLASFDCVAQRDYLSRARARSFFIATALKSSRTKPT
jgi:hypothetical protein